MRIEFTPEDQVPPSQYLSEGEFTCVITRAEVKNSKNGQPMVECEFSEASGRTCRDWFLLAAGHRYKLLQLTKAAGLNPSSFDTDNLLSKKVAITRTKTGTSEYMGKMRDNFENSYAAITAQTQDEIPF